MDTKSVGGACLESASAGRLASSLYVLVTEAQVQDDLLPDLSNRGGVESQRSFARAESNRSLPHVGSSLDEFQQSAESRGRMSMEMRPQSAQVRPQLLGTSSHSQLKERLVRRGAGTGSIEHELSILESHLMPSSVQRVSGARPRRRPFSRQHFREREAYLKLAAQATKVGGRGVGSHEKKTVSTRLAAMQQRGPGEDAKGLKGWVSKLSSRGWGAQRVLAMAGFNTWLEVCATHAQSCPLPTVQYFRCKHVCTLRMLHPYPTPATLSHHCPLPHLPPAAASFYRLLLLLPTAAAAR